MSIKIDMKNKVVSIGDVVIDMDAGVITIGADDDVVSEEKAVADIIQPPIVGTVEKAPRRQITAQQKAKFRAYREEEVGAKILIGGVLCTVAEHIKGTLYKVKVQVQRPSNSGGLPTSVVVNRYASHNRSKNKWSWWEDRDGLEGAPASDTPKTCSRCGMKGTNVSTCESVKSTDGTWLQVHRPTFYKEVRDNA
tara:strand:- start:32094 stop:32675 length:582 start_codon:yes stop_codon:yes gene_type:complete